MNSMVNYARNGMNSKDLFQKRLDYLNVYPIGPNIPLPISFRTQNYKSYGKINNRKDFVFVDDESLVQISNSGVFVLNFVADAFRDLEKYINTDKGNKLLPDNFFTTQWGPKRGWFNINEEYQSSMNTLYNNFIGPYLDGKVKHKDVINFETFLDIFFNEYLSEMIKEAPITKTGLVSSRFISPNASGLCIELSTKDHGDDNPKVIDFLSNPNFEFYALAASKFGFLIDQNAPWRLVANLNSPAMIEYARAYIKEPILKADTNQVITFNDFGIKGPHNHLYEIDENGNGKTIEFYTNGTGQNQPIAVHEHEIIDFIVQPQSLSAGTESNSKGNRRGIPTHDHLLQFIPFDNVTTDDLFTTFFIPTHYFDIENLKVYLLAFYNAYVSSYPVVAVPYYCKTGTGSGYFKALQIRNSLRETLDQEQFSSKYGDLFWLKAYFSLRLAEIGVDLDNKKKAHNLNKIQQIYFSLDFLSALDYIQMYLKQFY